MLSRCFVAFPRFVALAPFQTVVARDWSAAAAAKPRPLFRNRALSARLAAFTPLSRPRAAALSFALALPPAGHPFLCTLSLSRPAADWPPPRFSALSPLRLQPHHFPPHSNRTAIIQVFNYYSSVFNYYSFFSFTIYVFITFLSACCVFSLFSRISKVNWNFAKSRERGAQVVS